MPNQPYRIAVGRNNLGERWNRQATVRHVEALESNVANDGTSERAFCGVDHGKIHQPLGWTLEGLCGQGDVLSS